MRSQPKLKAKNYYQNQLIELKPFSQIEEEFFANLEQAKISQIADFMSAAKSANAKEISPERLGQLSQKINQLAPTIHPRDEDALTELSSIINDFAALGYRKYQLQNLEIKKLTNVFNQKINPSSREISRFLRSCSDMHYNKDELAIDEEKLGAEINEKLNNFNLDEKISLLNALARFEYRDQPEIPPAFKKVARDVLKKITQSQNCGADQTARYVGSLTRLNFDSELLESVDGKLSLNQKIQNALSAKIDQLSSNYASYLLLAQIFYESRLNINLLGSDLLGKVAEKYQPETTEVATSKLQKLVAKSLPKGGVTQEYPLHEINEKSVRDIDIHFVVKKDGSSIEYFIEVDGPDHFSFADKNHPTTNKATTERDNLNKHLISKLPTLSECRYLTINYQEIEAHKQNLKDFLVKKLQESEVIDMQPDVSIKAAAEFGKEVKAKEKKPTETVIEAKTIPAQPIKKPSAVELTAPKTIKKNGKEKKSPLEDAIENGRAADVIAIIRSGEVNIEDTLPNGQTH